MHRFLSPHENYSLKRGRQGTAPIQGECGAMFVQAAIALPFLILIVFFCVEAGWYILFRYQLTTSASALSEWAAANPQIDGDTAAVENYLKGLQFTNADAKDFEYCIETSLTGGSCNNFNTVNTTPPWANDETADRESYSVQSALRVPYRSLTFLGSWFASAGTTSTSSSVARVVEMPLFGGMFNTNWGNGQGANYQGPGNHCRQGNPLTNYQCLCPVGYTPQLVWEFWGGTLADSKYPLQHETPPTSTFNNPGFKSLSFTHSHHLSGSVSSTYISEHGSHSHGDSFSVSSKSISRTPSFSGTPKVSMDLGNPFIQVPLIYSDPNSAGVAQNDPMGAKMFRCINLPLMQRLQAGQILQTPSSSPSFPWDSCKFLPSGSGC